ncbi:MAG: IS21 family transposase, partial [Chloroflexi bacterium]|nr:IS21 family transposase [Chloroflexota bacterium]
VRKAIAAAEPEPYTLTAPRAAPVLGPYQARIDALVAENERLPRKQRYTSRRIYTLIRDEGYAGSESTVRRYIGQCQQEQQQRPVYLPLEFDPGTDAQVDWGEAVALIAGERVTVQLFYMSLCYSRRLFMMAFPNQKQEAFFAGHVHAFHHFQGVPQRLSYDNLKTAVFQVLAGHKRQEQEAFTIFRSHYLFDAHYCTPGQGHEKGRVEGSVGFGRRNFMVPIPVVDSFAALNAHLLAQCVADDQRRVSRQPATIGEAWELERPYLRSLPPHDYECCITIPVVLNPYSQVEFETNRYSVPAKQAYRQLVLKVYPFRIDIVHLDKTIASHPRCYGHQQDVLDPLHYLPLVAQRPGAFDHATPIRRWRATWPPVYEHLLAQLRERWPEGQGVREFIQVLQLHQDHPAALIEQAIQQALDYGCAHADGVTLCLHDLCQPAAPLPAALASWPLTSVPAATWATAGTQPLDLTGYDQLLEQSPP